MIKKNVKLIFILLVGVATVGYIVNFLQEVMNESKLVSIQFKNVIPADYLNLFDPAMRKDLSMLSGATFKTRNDVISLNYNKDWNIDITKICVKYSFDVKRDIVENYDAVNGTYPKAIMPISESAFNVNFKAISQDTVSKIHLTLNGEEIKTIIKNDTLVSYYLKMKNVYVQFSPSGPFEISMEPKNSFVVSKVPLDLMFIKRGDNLYFVLLNVNGRNKDLKPDLLYQLIK